MVGMGDQTEEYETETFTLVSVIAIKMKIYVEKIFKIIYK